MDTEGSCHLKLDGRIGLSESLLYHFTQPGSDVLLEKFEKSYLYNMIIITSQNTRLIVHLQCMHLPSMHTENIVLGSIFDLCFVFTSCIISVVNWKICPSITQKPESLLKMYLCVVKLFVQSKSLRN